MDSGPLKLGRENLLLGLVRVARTCGLRDWSGSPVELPPVRMVSLFWWCRTEPVRAGWIPRSYCRLSGVFSLSLHWATQIGDSQPAGRTGRGKQQRQSARARWLGGLLA